MMAPNNKSVSGVICAVLALLAMVGWAPRAMAQSTILPTETVPIPSGITRVGVPNQFELKLWQKLPSKFYFTSSVETTFRIETNPFQTATKRTILHSELPLGSILQRTLPKKSKFRNVDTAAKFGFRTITDKQEQAILQEVAHATAFDNVYRVNPNVTAGWSLTPNTQVFGTYFLIRDSLFNSSTLNSTTQAVGIGAQYTKMLGKRTSFQPQYTMREMYQTGQPNVFDYLPGETLQYTVTPNLIVFENSLLQLRFKHFMGEPMREIDPFHTIGLFYTKGRWTFSATGTLVQNFRHQFGRNALEPINNNSIILDFEVDRQIFPSLPSLQAIIRAEPVYNFTSRETTGLAGMDFRLYYGIRLSASKPALAGNIDQLRKRYLQSSVPAPKDISD
jgi:hypothetical protein